MATNPLEGPRWDVWKGLSLVQRKALAHAAAYGPFIRVPGGFWTCAGLPVRWVRRGMAECAWSVAVGTVRALETRGLVERSHTYDEEWKDTRELTALGSQVAGLEPIPARPTFEDERSAAPVSDAPVPF